MLFSGTTICCEKWIVDRRRQSTVRRVLGGMDTSQPFVHIVDVFRGNVHVLAGLGV